MKESKCTLAGYIIVRFDNIINGFLAIVMAPIFFGTSDDPIIQILSSYAAFVAIFVTEPIGAILFGLLGDKTGRKKLLLISILGTGFPAFIIGILPTYQQIGFLAPLLLIILRLIQGLFKEAEFSGVIIHNYEKGNRKTSSSANIVSLGGLSGCLAALICGFVTQNNFPNWGWRIPYIIGGLSCFAIYAFRRRIPESKEFLKHLQESTRMTVSLKGLLQNFKLEIATVITISACGLGTSYSSIFFTSTLFHKAGYSYSDTIFFSLFNMFLMAILVKMFGKIADKISPKQMLKKGLVTLIVSTPFVFLLISEKFNLSKTLLYMVIMNILSAPILSCTANYTARVFPVTCRYSGFTISDSIGSIIGSFTPFMLMLSENLFGSNFFGCIWILLLSCPALFLFEKMNQKQDKI